MYKISAVALASLLFANTVGAQSSPQKADSVRPLPTPETGDDRQPPKEIIGGVLNAKASSLPKPVYPEAAKAVKASGEVRVKILVDESGNVISAEAISGHPLLRAAAVSAASSAKFSPTILSGNPVKVAGTISYNFVPDPPIDPNEKGMLAEIPSADRDKIWALGAMFAFVQNADSEIVRLMGDEQEFYDILTDLSKDLSPNMEQYKPLLGKLDSKDLAVRSEGSREFLKMIRKDFSQAQNWQIDIGEQVGFLMAEVLRQKVQYIKSGVAFDENQIRIHLRRLSDLITSAPPDALPSVKEKFRRIASFAETPGLATDAKLTQLVDAITPLFEDLDDDKK